MTTIVQGTAGIRELAGQHLGYSDWLEIGQDRVNQFADATGDHQWIHVDPERATRESPYGGPIAHGYLTIALGPLLVPQVMQVQGMRLGVNYGSDRVRLPAPVPVGSKVRAGVEILEVTDIDGGVQAKIRVTIEVEGSEKPACVADNIYRYYD
jgi:acyl dehydratase